LTDVDRLTCPSEFFFVSWDDDVQKIDGKIKFMFQTTNQTSIMVYYGTIAMITSSAI